MKPTFSFIPEWMVTDHGPDEIRMTSCSLHISINNQSLTTVNDVWSKTVRESVRVSCYPLACWFASSWWRLSFEPVPAKPDIDWLMSHEMHGAGHGFLWPPLRFESDGDDVLIISSPSNSQSYESVRYLNHDRASIPVTLFMKAISSFIEMVLARLDALGIQHTELHTLWREVTRERADSRISASRKLEAVMGMDPDDLPEGYAEALLKFSMDGGEAAVAEVAAAYAGRDPSVLLGDIERSVSSKGISGQLSGLPDVSRVVCHSNQPWDRGWAMALATREALGMAMNPIDNCKLSDIFQMRIQDLQGDEAPMAKLPLSLAIQEKGGNGVKFLFRRRGRYERRFELARWLGDRVASGRDWWLPASDAKTARQKMQRAFAAEFLAPIQALTSFLEDEFTDEDRIDEAGQYFGVSPLTVKSQLSNHGLIAPDRVDAY